jgi:hypothetical protein
MRVGRRSEGRDGGSEGEESEALERKGCAAAVPAVEADFVACVCRGQGVAEARVAC